MRHVLQTGERELRQHFEGCVLNGDLLQSGKSPESERLDDGDVVAIEMQPVQPLEAVERVGADHGEVVLGQRQVLHGGWQVLRDVSQSPGVA